MTETMIKTEVTYTIANNGKFFRVEHVLVHICRDMENNAP